MFPETSPPPQPRQCHVAIAGPVRRARRHRRLRGQHGVQHGHRGRPGQVGDIGGSEVGYVDVKDNSINTFDVSQLPRRGRARRDVDRRGHPAPSSRDAASCF